MVAELLNLPGLVLEKLQLLLSVRRLSEKFGDTTSEGENDFSSVRDT